ncbi:hypothetical protein Q7C36_001910 [Tachysurus vachellii]|uniref:Uncharacterized protein n=1 Tax=Tachysurus vachellii TaxID=175792 RepID=A0AA88P5Z0_TACVA|nr:hypothetical protein Q7C36_001910 [Tachysurus vachellii]
MAGSTLGPENISSRELVLLVLKGVSKVLGSEITWHREQEVKERPYPLSRVWFLFAFRLALRLALLSPESLWLGLRGRLLIERLGSSRSWTVELAWFH